MRKLKEKKNHFHFFDFAAIARRRVRRLRAPPAPSARSHRSAPPAHSLRPRAPAFDQVFTHTLENKRERESLSSASVSLRGTRARGPSIGPGLPRDVCLALRLENPTLFVKKTSAGRRHRRAAPAVREGLARRRIRGRRALHAAPRERELERGPERTQRPPVRADRRLCDIYHA